MSAKACCQKVSCQKEHCANVPMDSTTTWRRLIEINLVKCHWRLECQPYAVVKQLSNLGLFVGEERKYVESMMIMMMTTLIWWWRQLECRPLIFSCVVIRMFTGCLPGYWGEKCLLHCQCSNGELCNPQTGQCDCGPGWRGRRCDRSECQHEFLIDDSIFSDV